MSQRRGGPVDVLQYLSDRSCARFSAALLALDATFEDLTMRHVTQAHYAPQQFPSLAIAVLREHGRVAIGDRVFRLKDGFGEEPNSRSVQRWLLEHPNTRQIRRAFPALKTDFSGVAEPIGDDERIPLLDVWPGLRRALPVDANPMLIRCDRIVDASGNDLPTWCVSRPDEVLLVRMNDERAELEAIVRELGLDVDSAAFDEILRRATQADVDRARSRVRAQGTDAERLLAAVSEDALLRRLPGTLIRHSRSSARAVHRPACRRGGYRDISHWRAQGVPARHPAPRPANAMGRRTAGAGVRGFARIRSRVGRPTSSKA